MKTLFEIHVLQNFAPLNLNRDDTGAPKDALFGGTVGPAYPANVSSGRYAKTSSRRRKVSSSLTNWRSVPSDCTRPSQIGSPESTTRLMSRPRPKSPCPTSSSKRATEAKPNTCFSLDRKRLKHWLKTIHQYWDKIVPPAEDPQRRRAGAGKKEQLPAMLPKRFARRSLFEYSTVARQSILRFWADARRHARENQNAACQVAHAISTHSVEREFDYYTAVDDLKLDDTAGADMMGTVEFNSACFYRYAVVDWEKLVENLQDDKELARKDCGLFWKVSWLPSRPANRTLLPPTIRPNSWPCRYAVTPRRAVLPTRLKRRSARERTNR